MNTKADIFNKQCPSREVLNLISNKWVILIIELLASQPTHFGELKRAIHGISAKVLTQSLKSLEHSGIILREQKNDAVIRVEYSLTPLGKSLSDVCKQITTWAETNYKMIITAREHSLQQGDPSQSLG